MYRKVIIVFIQVFLAQYGKIVQALTTLIFLVVCLAATALNRPFINFQLNTLESLSLLSSAITVYCGIFYIADASFKQESNFEMEESSKNFLFSMILICHVAFFIFWMYHFLLETRLSIRKRFPKVYTAVFLCCRKNKLAQELKIEKLQIKIAPFLQSMD